MEDTEGRRIYAQDGMLAHIFDGIGEAQTRGLERYDNGEVIPSLANALRLYRPVVIMDEAHNARTPLSFDALARFDPSCVIEFTATPETAHQPERGQFASNVLHHVSAAELKADEMIKLPIKLRTHGDWKEVVGAAVEKQRELERAAGEEERETGEYIRPIVLLQTQSRHRERQTLTVEVVKQCLTEDFRIPPEQIAIATGQTREIEGVDLFARNCPIRFIITVQALREGWDCPFAYVLCSVSEVSTPRAVEQVLGRVLRMPRARRKRRDELNCAYAYVASPRFLETMKNLQDALVENGFQRMEAGEAVTPPETGSLFGPGPLFAETAQIVTQPPDLSGLAPAIRQRVAYDAETSRLIVTGAIDRQEMEALRQCFERPEDRQAVERIFRQTQGIAEIAGADERGVMRVPRLAIRVGEQLELFDDSYFLDVEWNLAERDASLSEADFSLQDAAGAAGELDVTAAGQIEMRQFVERLHEQLTLLAGEPGWTPAALANWIDRQIPHPDIPQAQSSLFIYRAITGLMESRGLTIEQLARHKYRLCNAVAAKIGEHRRAQAREVYNALLFGPDSGRIEVSAELCFTFEKERYAPNWYYEGSFRFQKHHFPVVGELKADGEEFECAVFLDGLPEVASWVRNLERKGEYSFWLQTASDRFYPDFVARLRDGRILVVEYKGEHLWSNDDSKEKRAIGELWAERSGGACAFVMPKGKDFEAIRAVCKGV